MTVRSFETTVAGDALLLRVRAELAKIADPSRAPAMQAYMKSAMPFHGVAATPFRAMCKRVFATMTLADAPTWRAEVLALWRGARFREERYAAIELCADRRARSFQTMAALPMYEEIIVTGAWWDVVDGIATHRLGDILRAQPAAMKKTMRAWSKGEDMWKRRSAILCQNRFKRDTDVALLYECIAPSLASREFFLRKAIGWALREYAWTDSREVVRYVREHDAELSGLSKREALKNVSKHR
jgi:3-methyladenine DNA glycosylase AlkD